MSAQGLAIAQVEHVLTGGARVARLDLEATARLIIDIAKEPGRPTGPYYFSSVNGEVLARRRLDPDFARMIDSADLISADGQPLVVVTRLLGKRSLPERVETTDLYPIVAQLAEQDSVSFYLLGGTEAINSAAVDITLQKCPRLDIRDSSHGYLTGAALERKVDEINALAPDILWVGLGVPLEHEFVRRYRNRLCNVKIIKTVGGLFDFVAGVKPRAPLWMQKTGFEWAFRLAFEPRRLMRRYLTTNPLALLLLLTDTHSSEIPFRSRPVDAIWPERSIGEIGHERDLVGDGRGDRAGGGRAIYRRNAGGDDW